MTSRYNRLASESEETVKRLKEKVEKLENENSSLAGQLDEERRSDTVSYHGSNIQMPFTDSVIGGGPLAP